jgi:hypothetical protein
MKRALAYSAAAILIGAAVSQGVSLLCYYRAVNYSLGDVPLPPENLKLPSFLRDVWPPPASGTTTCELSTGRTSTTLHCPDPKTPAKFLESSDPGPAEYGLYTEEYGWPTRSATTCRPCVFTYKGNGDHMDPPAIFADFNSRAGLSLGLPPDATWPPKNTTTGLPVPILPLWSGLAINTLIYGAPVWLLLAVPGMLRRRKRRKQGRCLRCGYDLRGMTPCPECGV